MAMTFPTLIGDLLWTAFIADTKKFLEDTQPSQMEIFDNSIK